MLIQELKQTHTTVYLGDRAVGEIIIIFSPAVPDAVEVHSKQYLWTHNTYKQMLIAWESIKLQLREAGYTKIMTTALIANGITYPKYIMMFGFTEMKALTIAGVEVWYAEMRLE